MIKLFLVDDHTIVRDGIKALLADHPDFLIIGEAQSGDILLELLKQNKPDIILMDIALPGKSGIVLCRLIKELYPDIRILFLSMYTTEEFAVNAVQAGASGYLPKNISQAELLLAIRTIYAGEDYFSKVISDILLKHYLQTTKASQVNTQSEPLSKRENEILTLIAEGLSNTEISERLFISTRTVESHKNHIMQKLKLKTPMDLIKVALKNNPADI
ncbi:MAG: response regulator [Omnitrophica WOR_2 bacterium]